MEHVKQGLGASRAQAGTQNNTGALIIVTVLFFMWGLLTSLNDVLIPHLRSIYTLTYVQAMLVQFCFFTAYLVIGIPGAKLVKKIGYDPVFVPNGREQSFAEIDPAEKHAMSHRADAFRKLVEAVFSA